MTGGTNMSSPTVRASGRPTPCGGMTGPWPGCSLRVVADVDDNVIKEVLYDPFDGIIEDTNPALRLPLGFAGGLHDRDLGFVRFGWRDYDVKTGRWTAPDPLGDTGGDPDWYGYCLDDPVNGVDPLGSMGCGYRSRSPRDCRRTQNSRKKAAEKNPGSKFLQGLNRLFNGKELAEDPMSTDTDGDGISDYKDMDSEWNRNRKKK